MAKLVRAIPRRSPARYPKGTTLTLRDGRVFRVTTVQVPSCEDPSFGNGGILHHSTQTESRWELVPPPAPTREALERTILEGIEGPYSDEQWEAYRTMKFDRSPVARIADRVEALMAGERS